VKNSFGHVGYDGHVITLLRVFFQKKCIGAGKHGQHAQHAHNEKGD